MHQGELKRGDHQAIEIVLERRGRGSVRSSCPACPEMFVTGLITPEVTT